MIGKSTIWKQFFDILTHPDANIDVLADVVVNVQCDEPRVEPAAIELVSELLLRRQAADMSTLSAPHGVDTEADLRAVQGPGFRAIDGA